MTPGTLIFSNTFSDTGGVKTPLPYPIECYLDRNSSVELHNGGDVEELTSRRKELVKITDWGGVRCRVVMEYHKSGSSRFFKTTVCRFREDGSIDSNRWYEIKQKNGVVIYIKS